MHAPNKLTVHDAKQNDVYRDIVRVHHSQRNGIREGKICRVSAVGGRAVLLAVRGLPDTEKGYIRLDEICKDRLALNFGDVRDFTFRKAYSWEAVCWACNA